MLFWVYAPWLICCFLATLLLTYGSWLVHGTELAPTCPAKTPDFSSKTSYIICDFARVRTMVEIGQIFSNLTITAITKIGKGVSCLCACACGGQITLLSNELHRGTKDCGCNIAAIKPSLVGYSFGRLTILEELDIRPKTVQALCDCGTLKQYKLGGLLSGNTKSCGCLRKDMLQGRKKYITPKVGDRFGTRVVIAKPDTTHSTCQCQCGEVRDLLDNSLSAGVGVTCRSCAAKTHGMSDSVEYAVWKNMHSRVSPTNCNAKNYYQRGIIVCNEWRDFNTFYADMGPRPLGKSIDRVDNDGNYTKANCRWATAEEQNRNKDRKGSKKRGVVLLANGKWVAQIHLKTLTKHLGTYTTYDEAVQARIAAEDQFWAPAGDVP